MSRPHSILQIRSYLPGQDVSLGALAEWEKGASKFAEDEEHGVRGLVRLLMPRSMHSDSYE